METAVSFILCQLFPDFDWRKLLMGILKSNIGGNYADNVANIVKLIDNISKENKNRNDHDSIKLID